MSSIITVGRKKLVIETVLFDLDDTLIPTTDILRNSFHPAYELIKQKTPHTLKQFIEKMRNIRKRQKSSARYYYSQKTFQKYLTQYKIVDEDTIARATKMFILYNDKRIHIYHDPKTYRDAIKLLEFLVSVDCSAVIITTGDKWDQHEKLIRTRIMEKIQYAEVSQKDDKTSKIRSVIRYAGSDPKKTLFVGDNPRNDINSAKKNGCVAFRIKNGRRKKLKNGRYKPDKTFTNIREIHRYLKKHVEFA